MGDRGGYRGRGRDGGRRGRGDFGPPGAYGGRGDYGGGRGDYGGRGGGGRGGGGRGGYGGRGRGDFGGRGRSDFGGRGRGDFGGRGRGDGGGRGGGRGRGGGFFGGPLQPMRDAQEGTAARPGKRLPMINSETAVENLTKLIGSFDTSLVQSANVRPKRPGVGRSGRPTQVYANHFPVKINLQQAAHYDIEIKGVRRDPPEGAPPRRGAGRPEKPLPIPILRQVMQALAQQQKWSAGDWAFDGRKNLYSPKKFLPQQAEYQVSIQEEGRRRPRDFEVAVAYVASVNVAQLLSAIRAGSGLEIPQDAIQALDVALKHSTADNALCTTVSRNFFFEGSGSTAISGGAEVWLGYKQSLRPCENGLTLNIDVAATAFLQPVPVLQYLAGILRRRDDLLTLEDRTDLRKATKALSGLQINTTHGNTKRKYKVKGIKAEGGAANTFFTNEQEGREMSVAEYFQQQYNIRLRFPNHPLVNVGNPAKAIYLPIEVCKLAAGQRQLKLDAKQTADMIKITAQKPEERHRRIMKALTEDSKLPSDPAVRGFGMQVATQMETVNARLLGAPALKYAEEFGVPSAGSWNLKDRVRFNQTSSFDSYALVSFASERDVGSPGPEGYPAFVSHQLRKLQELGINTPNPNNLPPVIYHDGRNMFPGESLEEAVKRAHSHFKATPKIIFVLLPDNSATNGYTDVKRASDSFLGIPSQCFAANKAKIGERDPRGREQYLANVCMKINAKLNGTNVVLSRNPCPWMDRPYIVFGADVTHSRGFDTSEPSVAAVVGSMNATCTRYAAEVKMQGHRVEMIQDLKNIIKNLLMTFYQQAGRRKPERLIFYRDGVSEGQFPEVQRFEIPQIIAACRELGQKAGEDYSPPLTFVVAQKRHNTRFFPTNPRDADRSGNVQPGLVVDTKVVHPSDFSFFLNSHAGLQGTSRPCHYHVLLDQNKFGADELQNFTNSLCYLYCRCTKSVSIVIPAYYAHLAAFRGRAMLAHNASSSDSESMVSGTSGSRATSYAEYADIHQNLKTCMFYV